MIPSATKLDRYGSPVLLVLHRISQYRELAAGSADDVISDLQLPVSCALFGLAAHIVFHGEPIPLSLKDFAVAFCVRLSVRDLLRPDSNVSTRS